MKNCIIAYCFTSILLFLHNSVMAQGDYPYWKVDSLLFELDHPEVSYEFNFNFSFNDLNKEDLSSPNPLEKLSIEELQEKLTGELSDAKIYGQLVFRYLLQNDESKAFDVLQKGFKNYETYLNENPSDSAAVEELADLLLATQNYDLALQVLDLGIKNFPKMESLHLLRFQLLFYNMGKYEVAGNYIDSLVQVFPESGELVYMGFMKDYTFYVMEQNSVPDEIKPAMKKVDEYLARDPNSPVRQFLHHYCRANLYMFVKSTKASALGYEGTDILIRKPEGSLSQAQLDDIKETIRFLKKEQKKDRIPQGIIAKTLTMCYVLLGNQKQIEKMLMVQKDFVQNPEEKVALEEAIALFYIISSESALSETEAVLRQKYQSTSEPKDLLAIAVLYDDKGLKDKATEQIKKAIQAHPEYGPAYEMKAYLELKAKEFDKAASSIEKAKEKTNDLVYPFLLSVIHQAATENAIAADTTLQELIDAQPENETALAFRKWLIQK